MSRLKRLIHEIHRRSLWQVLSVYLVSSWVTLQVADTVTAALGLPDWVPQAALVLLIVLLPVVLATAFVQEGVGGARAEPAPEAEKAEGEPTPEIPAPEPRGAHHRVLTWRNAIAAAVTMLALLTISAGGYMGLRAAGIGPFASLMSKGVLAERDRIVLADFENHTPDSLLAMAATQLFRTALGQSQVVNVADEEYVAAVLRRMEKEPGTALDYDLARELAIREGLKAVIGGEVMSVGASYLVSARLVAAELGDVLWTDSETAGDSTAIIPAVDRLSRRLRQRVGESLKTIRPNEPLAEVTTSSLQALKKYTQAYLARRLEGDQARAIALLEEAIAIDTMFASAYRHLGSVLSDNAQDRQRAVRAFTRAYELRHRATELERYKSEAGFYYHVTREFDKAATTLRTLLDTYENRGARNLLANTYWWLGEYALAEPLYKQNLAEDTLSPLAHDNLLFALVAQNKFDEAQETFELMAQRLPNHPWYRRAGFRLALITADYETAEAHARALRQAQGGDLLWRAATSRWLSALARLRGQLVEYERYRRDAMATNDRRGLPAQCLLDAISLGATDAWFHGPSDRAERIVEDALTRYPLESMEPLDRPYMNLAFFYAVSGNTERARVPLAEFEAEIDPVLRADQEPSRHLQLSLIALAEGYTDQAIEEARIALESTSPLSELPALFRIGWAYDNAGEADSAVAYYEQWLGTPHYGQTRSLELPKVYERLGDLYEQRGDTAKAIYYYGKLVDLWKDADPELQPRVEAARRAIEALSPDT